MTERTITGGPGRTALDAVAVRVWHVAAFACVVILPLYARTGGRVWASAPTTVLQALMGGSAYLVAALVAGRLAGRSLVLRLGVPVLASALAFSAFAAIPFVAPSVPISRALLGIAFGLTLALVGVAATAPPGALLLGSLGLAAAAAVPALRSGEAAEPESYTVDSEFYLLRVSIHAAPVLEQEAGVEGGGLTRAGDDLLLVSGSGRFARIRPGEGSALTIEPLTLTSPANTDAFVRDVGAQVATGFRVVDLLAEPLGDSVHVYVSHHFWRDDEDCYVLRVSVATGHDDLATWSPWRTVFDAEPCLRVAQGTRGIPFSGPASGGRMVRLPEGILLTVGDHLLDGLNSTVSVPRDPASHYGKTVLLREDGSAEIFTLGHRNPQGLARDAQGRLWATEHGPKGGDELNLIEAGADYGWPQRTMGTEYGLRAWPLLTPPDPALREPRFAFVPSVGISNLIAPTDPAFADWRGDLLIGALKAREFLRVRLDGDRPVYVEPIALGYEVRDLEEAGNGTLVVWTDQRRLLSIAPDTSDRAGAALAAPCAGCHTLNEGQNGGLGPNLFGVVGRPVAGGPGFDYSDALRDLGGRWTRERLDAFLADPAGFAPGNRMVFQGVPDADRRRQLIEYLAAAGTRQTGPPR